MTSLNAFDYTTTPLCITNRVGAFLSRKYPGGKHYRGVTDRSAWHGIRKIQNTRPSVEDTRALGLITCNT